MLFALTIVIFLVVTLTVVILSAGIVEPTAYGEVPAAVTTTWYFCEIAVVDVALERFAPVSKAKVGESATPNVCDSYNLLYEYEKSPIVLCVI